MEEKFEGSEGTSAGKKEGKKRRFWGSILGMTASRQWGERMLYLFCGGFKGGRDWRGMEYSPPKITVKRASWARGVRPPHQCAPTRWREGFRGRGRIGGGFPPKCFSLFPSFSVPLLGL